MENSLLTLRTYSLTYQHIINEDRVPRPNLVNEIEDMFDKDCKIVIIEGKEGGGKTDIMLQFAKKHGFDSFTFFINPHYRGSYKQDYLLEDLGRQMFFFNKSQPVPEDLDITETVFNKLIFNLTTSNSGRRNSPIYFVLDGLDRIDKSDFELLKNTLQNLPWNANNFYFLLSGNIETLKNIFPPGWLKNSKSLRVPRFTEPETKQLFNLDDSQDSVKFLHEVHSTWKGHPDSLSDVKRILDSGISKEDFLSDSSISEKNDLLEIEWKRAKLTGQDLSSNKVFLISILAFDDNIRSVSRIAGIINISTNELNDLIFELSFLNKNDDNIFFASNSYRQYATQKLSRFEKETNSRLIDYYMSTDDLSSALNLPNLFQKNSQWNNIVELLTVDKLDLIISNSKSFSDIKKQINHGFKAANNLKNAYNDIFRFSIHRSTLTGLQSSDNRKNKIRSYIVLDIPEEAFNIIANSVLKEDRLKMLIFFVQYSKIEKKNVDSAIVAEIKELLEHIDLDYVRENLMDMAIGLAYFLPNEAIQLIEKALNLREDNNSIEWLMGIIGMIASENKESSNDGDLQLQDKESKKDSFAEKFAKSIGYGISEVSPDEILMEIQKVEKSGDRIFLMRKWIKSNPESSNIYEIIDFTLNLLSQESSVKKPSTEALYDIVFPIKYFTDQKIVESMVKRIDDLMININTPTIGKVKLDIAVIEALFNVHIDEANNRTIVLTDFINNLTDICIKLECYANLWTMWNDIRHSGKIDLEYILIDEKFLKNEINNLLKKFLESIADQHEEIEDTLYIISKLDFAFALNIASMLNTSSRRDKACQTCLESYIDNNFVKWNLDDIEYAINQINSENIRTDTIEMLFEKANEVKDESRNNKKLIVDLLPLINSVKGYETRCKLISLTIILLGLKATNNPQYVSRYDNLITKLNSFLSSDFNKIQNPIKKIRMGYQLASSLGTNEKKLAGEYFQLAESVSKETTFEDVTHLALLCESIRIIIRIFSGLIKKTDTDYEKIGSLIILVPTQEDQVMLWSELSVRLYLAGKLNMANQIVNSKLMPVLDSHGKNSDQSSFFYLFARSASAIHLSQPATFALYLNKLSIEKKEELLPLVFSVLLSNCHESDPFDSISGAFHFKYQTAIEYLNLLNVAETDALIQHYIRSFTKIVKSNPTNFTRIQKGELYQKLTDLIKLKLPNKKTGIKHDGYLISALACAEILNISGADKSLHIFNELEKKVATLSSVTDRAVVYLNIANELESNKKKRTEIFKLAFSEIEKIPSIKERISMYQSALESVLKFSTELFNQYLKIVEKDIYNLDENEQYPTFKKLIDLAYRCDKNIAQRLISNLDTDPARKKLSEPANNHYEKLDLEKAAQTEYSNIGKIKDRREKSTFAWNLLGQLNSDKRKARDTSETLSFIHSASAMPFFFSIPLYEFFIENIIKSDDKDNLLLSLYDSANANARLCYNLICNISNKNSSAMSYHVSGNSNSIIVNPGMQEEAMNFIKNFMTNTESKEIYIVDPYFSDKDMHFLKRVDEWCYNSSTTILSSVEAGGEFTKTNYIAAWESQSLEVPPSNTFIFTKNQNNKSPFHDRYILLYDNKLGLRLGSSINGISGKKTFEISMMVATEVEDVYETIIRPLVHQRLKEYADQTIKYESFDF